MSEFLRDLLTKAKENADTLDTPGGAVQGSVLHAGPAEATAGAASESALPVGPISRPARQIQSAPPYRDSTSIRCPSCDLDSVVLVNRFRRVGAAIGGILGAMVGSSAGRTAVTVLLSAAGGLAGVILGAIFGAGAGAWAGRNLGNMIDEDMICQYKCLKCNHTFYI